MTDELSDRLLENSHVARAEFVAAFYPAEGEPDILPALRVLAAEGRLLLPRTGKACSMEFFKVGSLDELEKGRFGIMEPAGGAEPFTGTIEVFLVPGTAFSLAGARRGHGMGFYDRFLAKFPAAWKIGVCRISQISDGIEMRGHDVWMDEVLPELYIAE